MTQEQACALEQQYYRVKDLLAAIAHADNLLTILDDAGATIRITIDTPRRNSFSQVDATSLSDLPLDTIVNALRSAAEAKRQNYISQLEALP